MILVASLFLPAIAVLLYNLYFDPFQIFHKDLEQPTVILNRPGTDRYQQAGIINQYNIESAIIGNSYSANYFPSKMEKEYGWENVYTLTMDGLPLYEQAIVTKYLLKKHTIKNIQWGISINNFFSPWDQIKKRKERRLKQFLYDKSRLNDFKFFLTFDLHKYIIRKQARKKKIRSTDNFLALQKEEFDKSTSWYKRRQCDFNRPRFVAKKILKETIITYDELTITKLSPISKKDLINASTKLSELANNYKKNFSNNLFPIIAKNHNTKFNFVITPRPSLWLQNLKLTKLEHYLCYLRTIKKFVKDSQQFQNVRIFAFNIEKFTDDLRLFKDSGHFHLEVNNYLIEKMAHGEGMLTLDNIDQFLMVLDYKISNFRLPDKWIPQDKNIEKGYLSLPAARLLIVSNTEISDEQITNLSLSDSNLSKCAKEIKKSYNQQ